DEHEVRVDALVDDAADAFDAGNYQKALSCAESAIVAAPRAVPALHYRAAALAALGRTDESRTAYARALAVDPGDPETLWGAADLYISRLGRDREALETGLEYAQRGARYALKSPHKDRDLAGRLHLLAGMALNDLGRSKQALQSL